MLISWIRLTIQVKGKRVDNYQLGMRGINAGIRYKRGENAQICGKTVLTKLLLSDQVHMVFGFQRDGNGCCLPNQSVKECRGHKPL